MKRILVLIVALALIACGGGEDDNNDTTDNNGATNNGGSNNGTTNNGATNNGATNNGATNNGATNNGATNNGATNNGTTNNMALKWYHSCGDPVCNTNDPMDDPNLANCTTEMKDAACTTEGATCDPQVGCGVKMVCAVSDPTTAPGGCPKSRKALKTDIAYLGDAERRRLHRELVALPLATYRYRNDAFAKERLGFMIEEADGLGPALDAERDRIDQYSYTSAVVAALQVQQKQIEALRVELASLKSTCAQPATKK
jgi:hypothetical protein